jgi:hypothetical protein
MYFDIISVYHPVPGITSKTFLFLDISKKDKVSYGFLYLSLLIFSLPLRLLFTANFSELSLNELKEKQKRHKNNKGLNNLYFT